MNKIAFALSGVLTLISIVVLFLTNIITLVLPKLGYVAFQAVAAGSYSESAYKVDFTGINTGAIILVILSLLSCVYFFIKESKR